MSIPTVKCYEVREIESGLITYRGNSLINAATKLIKGTCYGQGATPVAAHHHAELEVVKFQEAEK